MNENFFKKGKLSDIGRWYVNGFVEYVAKSLRDDSRVLDAGAGESVYKPLFSHCEYKAIDLAVGESKWNYSNLDYIGALHDMPIANEQFDAILCTQVLEHLELPHESVAEMFRVLKHEGRIFITAPMAHREHQTPYDFYRYTSYGLRSILRNAGFGNIEVKPFGGFLIRWAYELPRLISLFPSTGIGSRTPDYLAITLLPVKYALLVGIKLTQLLLIKLDRLDRRKDYPFGWSCEAVKPALVSDNA